MSTTAASWFNLRNIVDAVKVAGIIVIVLIWFLDVKVRVDDHGKRLDSSAVNQERLSGIVRDMQIAQGGIMTELRNIKEGSSENRSRIMELERSTTRRYTKSEN